MWFPLNNTRIFYDLSVKDAISCNIVTIEHVEHGYSERDNTLLFLAMHAKYGEFVKSQKVLQQVPI